MKFIYFVVYLLLATADAYSMWSEERDEDSNNYGDNQDGNNYGDNQDGNEENISNYNESSENSDPYNNQNSDSRRDSPYNYPSFSGQSELRGDYDMYRGNNEFADNRMYSQPDEYNNQDDGFYGRDYNRENSNENESSNEITDRDTDIYYGRDEGYPGSNIPNSQGGYDYRALKRKIGPIPRPNPRPNFASTDDFHRNTYEPGSTRGSPVSYGELGGGHHNRNIFNFHNKIIYTK